MAISSTPGAGARVDLVLPLSVAVIDAFLVECRAGLFAVPSGCVERVEMIGDDRLSATGAGRFLRCAPARGAALPGDAVTDTVAPGDKSPGDSSPGQFVPLVDLDAFLGTQDAVTRQPGGRRQVLHYRVDGAAGALSVDRVVQRAKLLVKPLGLPLERLRRYSGSALLDDGRVALILEVSSLRGQAA
jgi:two-component system chemotaxis sensor kinase CheA